jgi:hypothetical protein
MFKECTACQASWETRDAFLSDPDLKLVGYQASFRELTAGFFLFTHSCGTTMAIPVHGFEDLVVGPVFETPLIGSDRCEEHCLHEDDLEPCPAACECGYVRDVLQVVREWPKETAGQG